MGDEAIEELSELRADLQSKLSAPDAVFDPHVQEWLVSWIESSQDNNLKRRRDVDYAIDMLTNGYSGYPCYVKMMMKWMEILDKHSTNKRPKSESENDVSVAESKVRAHLAAQTVDAYSVEKIASIFQEDQPPNWLIEMLKVDEWRKLLGTIAAKDSVGPLVDFAVKALCSAGYHQVFAESEKTVAFFSVFKYMVVDTISAILEHDSSNPQELEKLREKFQGLCSQSQFSHLYALEFLGILEASEVLSDFDKAKVRRLRQGLELAPAAKQAQLLDLLNPINRRCEMGLSASFASGGIPDLAAVLRAAMSQKQYSADVISQLVEMYRVDPENPTRIMPVWPIRNSSTLMKLQQLLYNPFRSNIDDATLKGACFLCAVASSRPEINDLTELKPALETEAQLTADIEESVRICRDPQLISPAAIAQTSKGMTRLVELIQKHPPIGAGAIAFVRCCLKDTHLQRSDCYTIGTRTLMHILRVIMGRYPLQHIIVFYAILDGLATRPSHIAKEKYIELKKYMIDELIALLKYGFVYKIMDHVTSGTFDAQDTFNDQILLRYFIESFCKAVADLSSLQFAETTMKFLTSNRVTTLRGQASTITSISDLKQKCSRYIAAHSQSSATVTPQKRPALVAPNGQARSTTIRLVPFRPAPHRSLMPQT